MSTPTTEETLTTSTDEVSTGTELVRGADGFFRISFNSSITIGVVEESEDQLAEGKALFNLLMSDTKNVVDETGKILLSFNIVHELSDSLVVPTVGFISRMKVVSFNRINDKLMLVLSTIDALDCQKVGASFVENVIITIPYSPQAAVQNLPGSVYFVSIDIPGAYQREQASSESPEPVAVE
jgi:hypothetical protein